MPTIYGMKLPEPSNWQEFELITLDSLKLQWRSPNLQRNGRAGQAQNGVDIYGTDHLGRLVGVQCKNTVSQLKLKTVKAEIENANSFKGILGTLFVATTAKTDEKLQREVRLISENRAANNQFAVGLLYWEDIYSGLALDRTVLSNHYPGIALPGEQKAPSIQASKLSALAFGYYGRFLWEYIDLVFGEFGWMAQEDPEQLRTILRMLKKACKITEPDDERELKAWLHELETTIFAEGADKQAFQKAKRISKTIAIRIKNLSDLIEDLAVGNFVEIGISIGAVYHANGKFTQKRAENLARQIVSMIPESEGRLADLIPDLLGRENYNASPALYTFVERELRWSRPPA